MTSKLSLFPNPEHSSDSSTESRALGSLSDYLFSALGPEKSLNWKKRRRCTELLPRALFSVLHCDKLLRDIPTTPAQSVDHGKLIHALRMYSTSGQNEYEKHPNWQLWTISCLINDAQHRIAATLDRCINFWALDLGLGGEDGTPEIQNDRRDLDDYFIGFTSGRFAIVRLFVAILRDSVNARGAARSVKHDKLSDCSGDAIKVLDKIISVFKKTNFLNTNHAAKQISTSQAHFTKVAPRLYAADEFASVGTLLFKQTSEGVKVFDGEKTFEDGECLAIVIARVNDFKHRATQPGLPGEYWDMTGPYLQHVELAITTQALISVINFYKTMAAHLESASVIRGQEVQALVNSMRA